jgi:hypothetical protein
MDQWFHQVDQPANWSVYSTCAPPNSHACYWPCAPHVDLVPPVQAVLRSSRCNPAHSIIFVVRSAILINCQLFFSFDQSFCYIITTVLNHSCYSARSFLLQWSAILLNSVIPRCYSAQLFSLRYSAQSFFIELQCSTILVNSTILCATVLNHFPLSYNA